MSSNKPDFSKRVHKEDSKTRFVGENVQLNFYKEAQIPWTILLELKNI